LRSPAALPPLVWAILFKIADDIVSPTEVQLIFGSADTETLAALTAACDFVVLSLFAVLVAWQMREEAKQQRAARRWLVGTIRPPTMAWTSRKDYACFLSHFKVHRTASNFVATVDRRHDLHWSDCDACHRPNTTATALI